MRNYRRIFTCVCFMSVFAMLLSACGGVSPTLSGTGTPETTASAVPTPEATPEVTPEPTPEASDKYGMYVDPVNGDDENDGRTHETAVKTIERAQQLARELSDTLGSYLARIGKDLTVYLRGGVYYFDETLTFTSEDGGNDGYDVVWTAYKDEKPVFSGGTPITGWTLHDEEKNIYVADAQGITSRDFYVDGERATRSQYTWMTNKFHKIDGGFVMEKKLDFPTSLARPQDLEIFSVAKWQYSILPVDNAYFDESGNLTMTVSPVAWGVSQTQPSTGAVSEGNIHHLENAYEFLNDEGEWYLNTDEDKIYYIPKEGQDMSAVDAVLGKLEHIVNLDGTEKKKIEHITFSGITFSHTTYLQPFEAEGYCVIYSSKYYTGDGADTTVAKSAVTGQFVSYITFTENTFVNLGSTGLYLKRCTNNTKIIKNTFTDCGGGGIMVGGFDYIDHYNNGSDVYFSLYNVIEDNYIENIGTVYWSSCGIFAGYVGNISISHNTLKNLPYSGIALGWLCGVGGEVNGAYPVLQCGNKINNNYVSNVMLKLEDGGAIYTLGRMDGSEIRDNYAEGSRGEGIYLDEGAQGMMVTNNVLYKCNRSWIFKGNSNYIFDNYADNPEVGEYIGYQTGNMVLNYLFHNNYMWDEDAIEVIKNAAGVRE